MSALLVLAQLLRYRMAWLQALQLPAAIVAGLIALALGPFGLELLPFSLQENGVPQLSTYPSFLIAIVFACVGLARPKGATMTRRKLQEVGDTFFYSVACEVGQYAVAMLFGLLVLSPLFPDLPPGFAILLPTGWAGGHGTAAAVGSVLEAGGWANALPLAYTSATAGVAFALIGGMSLIHLAIRKGWTRFVRRPADMPESFRTGFIPAGERGPAGEETVSAVTIDTLTWHLAIVGSATGMAYAVFVALPSGHGLPLFAFALLTALVLRFGVRVGRGWRRSSTSRRSAESAERRPTTSSASASRRSPSRSSSSTRCRSALLMLLGMAITLGQLRFLGPRMFRSFWFERSLFAFGWNTGVVATGITLVRVVDPEDQSRTLEDFGLAYPAVSFIEITIVTVLPLLLIRGIVIAPTLVLVAITGASLVLSRVLLGWSKVPPAVVRPSEIADQPELNST